ncbi:IMPACT family member YigZ [Clostridiaceae bacterium BL-3]|nr:IMPACT family member YigZ [Clostridiaceae bacterium BL-3]
MGYFTVKNQAGSRFEEKKSIFIGNVKRVYTEGDARRFINRVKEQNPKASHNVYAYVIGEKMNIQRYSDDREPQGTAGIPILEVIKKKKLTDIVTVVTRYFGGILLGKGGLAKAYSKSAVLSIDSAKIVERVKGSPIDISINYEDLGKLQHFFEQKSIPIENIEYADKVQLSINCILENVDLLINEIIDVTNGKCELIVGDEEFYFKVDNNLIKE